MKKKEDTTGVGCTDKDETLVRYNTAQCEVVFAGKNNTWIVLGRDRPADIFSGYGGGGAEKAGSIDIVVGRASGLIKDQEDGENVFANPSTVFDAGRLLLSQKTDVDENFNLPNGKVGNRKGKSAAALKADNVRLIAREGIKLVANSDRFDSNGELKATRFGIDLLSTDGQKIQPIPKGENLNKALEEILNKIAQISTETANLYRILISLCSTLAAHIHESPVGPTSPSIELALIAGNTAAEAGLHIGTIQTTQVELELMKKRFLSLLSEESINSRFHNLD